MLARTVIVRATNRCELFYHLCAMLATFPRQLPY